MDKFDELGCKLAAKILLQNTTKGIITPDRDEWIGVNLLERDDELKRLSKDNVKCTQQELMMSPSITMETSVVTLK